jgi:hypothetical protein
VSFKFHLFVMLNLNAFSQSKLVKWIQAMFEILKKINSLSSSSDSNIGSFLDADKTQNKRRVSMSTTDLKNLDLGYDMWFKM